MRRSLQSDAWSENGSSVSLRNIGFDESARRIRSRQIRHDARRNRQAYLLKTGAIERTYLPWQVVMSASKAGAAKYGRSATNATA